MATAVEQTATTTKKTILVQRWTLRDGGELRSFTAAWCAPCRRIKPYLEELREAGLLTLLETEELDAPAPGLRIPRFELVQGGAIQTSSAAELGAFLFVEKN